MKTKTDVSTEIPRSNFHFAARIALARRLSGRKADLDDEIKKNENALRHWISLFEDILELNKSTARGFWQAFRESSSLLAQAELLEALFSRSLSIEALAEVFERTREIHLAVHELWRGEGVPSTIANLNRN